MIVPGDSVTAGVGPSWAQVVQMAESRRGGNGSVPRDGSCVLQGRPVPGKHRTGIWTVTTAPMGSL